ncbi:alpha/beta fold hydrolase [Massilia sp. W12]|uniref:extracellular native short-chain-length polyhydroxyalkanoate depolymerase PhaZ7 n=1 Tax=Massilia sp. W12 TaxID=3126507 RepID=UPI0030CDF27A
MARTLLSTTLLLTCLAAPLAQAVTCGTYNRFICTGPGFEYGGGFAPNAGEYGGFGGAAACTPSRTPVIFVHGNGDSANSWDAPPSQVPGYAKPPHSVYQQFKAAGYKDCELFGVTWLSSSERGTDYANYHQPAKYDILMRFINAVKKHTGKTKVDIIGHSMGVSLAIATMNYYSAWGNVRRFINVAGGINGLDSCIWTGYANPMVPTCGSQNVFNPWIFGFYPNIYGNNPWTGTSWSGSLPNAAISNPGVNFYTVHAGLKDQFMCSTVSNRAICSKAPLLRSAPNLKAQLDIGAGSDTLAINWDWSTGSPWNQQGGDWDGVGHFHAKTNGGSIFVKMLSTTCTSGCAADYQYGPVQAN